MTALWQPSTLQPRDAEVTVGLALADLLAAAGESDVWIDRKVPDPRPARAVIVTRDGGAFDGLIDRARLRFRVYDTDDAAVNALARTVIRLWAQLVANGTATHVEHLSGPLDVTDASEAPQRYLLAEIHLRGESA